MPVVPLAARLLNPIVWYFPGHRVRKLHSFALAEHGSLLDMQAAANQCDDPERAAQYLRHACDEGRHAQLFVRRARELAEQAGVEPPPHARADAAHLFEQLGEVDFLAFVHRGESRGRQQFETYRDWFGKAGDGRTEQLFKGLVADETGHESYSLALLEQLAPEGSRAAQRRMWARELWHAWLRAGRGMAGAVYVGLMWALYPMLWPFSLWVRWVRPLRSGWAE